MSIVFSFAMKNRAPQDNHIENILIGIFFERIFPHFFIPAVRCEFPSLIYHFFSYRFFRPCVRTLFPCPQSDQGKFQDDTTIAKMRYAEFRNAVGFWSRVDKKTHGTGATSRGYFHSEIFVVSLDHHARMNFTLKKLLKQSS